MNKKAMALFTVISWLSVAGIVSAENQIYYGHGDGDNTGNIFDVEWVLNGDYRYYGGHQSFFNAYTQKGTASRNILTVNGGTYAVNGNSDGSSRYANYFYGGLAISGGNAKNNGIIINNGNFINESGTWQAAGIYAAQASGEGYVASDNYVTVNGGIFQGYTYISGGLAYRGSDSVDNSVTVHDGNFEKGIYIFGGRGYSTGNTDRNTVTVTGGAIGGYRAFIWGGKADNGDARYNTVDLSGGAVASMPSDESIYENKFTEYEQGDAEFYGGYTLTGNAVYNTVNISGGSVSTSGKGLVYGGYSQSGNANYNTANIFGGSISSKMILIGGFSAGGNASGNVINLTGGSGNGEVYLYGGMTMNSAGNATDNKISVYFPARLKDIYGGVYLTENGTDNFTYHTTNSGDLRTGNELYLASSGVSANNIYNFQTLKFLLPSSYQSSSNMLTLTGANATDLTNTNLVLTAAGNASLAEAQTINLISSARNISYGSQTTGTLRQGVSLSYDYTLKKDSHNLQAVLGNAKFNDEANSFVETRAAQTAFLNKGADLLVAEGLSQAEETSQTDDEWSPFFTMQGGNYRYKTGSYVDNRGFNFILGLAREIGNDSGKWIYGFAGEYGKGNYDSYRENMHGEGDSDYFGASIFVRRKNVDGMYYEGSLRAGKTNANYSSLNFSGYEGESVSYDSKSSYVGGHLGLGKKIKLSGDNELDVAVRYFHSHVGGDSVNVSTGENYDFSAVNSRRLRIGTKLTHAFNEMSKGYFGVYGEREFAGDAKSAVLRYSTATPSLKGNIGVLEIGLLHQPKDNFALNVGFAATFGQQRGETGKVSMMWKF